MFCYQCEQTAKGAGCDRQGVCGKNPEVSDLQDLLVYAVEGLSWYADRARARGRREPAVDRFVLEALFTTVTNVNFDADRVEPLLRRAVAERESLKNKLAQSGEAPADPPSPATWTPPADRAGLLAQAAGAGIEARRAAAGDTVAGLQWLVIYGLKGAAAYADHAQILGVTDESVCAAFHSQLAWLAGDPREVGDLLAHALQVGELNLKAMELLDKANTDAYGHPEPTAVRVTPRRGKAILVSGHDLKDLEELLKQTAGKGINVYTHGEMLPANAYPGLKKHPHLAGHYGTAWQNQQKEFAAFPGAILMTTNCIQRPQQGYAGRIFTSGLVAWPGVTHVGDGDFSPVIAAAQAAPGFAADAPEEKITVGFARQAVLNVAGAVVDAVKQGAVKHFFLIGGCDGAKPGRNYYTDFARQVPANCVILTLACGKFRFNREKFGEIGGIPRLLDIGQCNDAYSAIQIAVALAQAFGTEVNKLPLSLVLSWYEQKAVAILLTLLHLGIRDIRLGPSLPAFVTPEALQVLVDKFAIKPITTPEADLKAILS